MLSRSARAVARITPTGTRAASTPSATPYKRSYAPRTASARSPATSSPRSAAGATKTATAAPVKPVPAPAPAPPTPSPVLDELPPAEFDPPPVSPPAASTASAGSSFVRSTPASLFEPTPSAPAASPSSSSSAPPQPAVFAPSPLPPNQQQQEIDWSTSYHGLSASPFTREQAEILMRPLEHQEIEIKPDGLLYLPEILYRRILNKAFGPGGWGMVPRGEMTVLKNMVTREWGLVAGGRLVSVARGEQTFFDPSGMPTATEGCKSNALMRCCKDLGIASELWDPVFIRAYKTAHCVEAWTEHVVSKKKQKRWRKKHNKFDYPYSEARV
ncbi:hypothetical protein JCM8547_002385 [Rhodosporidiobolus lusitaniae]